MRPENQAPDELLCSICMCIFNSPITIECGHTFCRICLLNSTSIRRLCPICRKNLNYLSERPVQDHTLSKIVQYCHKSIQQQEVKNIQNEKLVDQSQSFLLLDIRSNDLLLPYTRVVGTFQLQSPTLLGKVDRFVARQQTPFNKFGVLAKVTTLNQLKFNLYECTIEGKAFCQIQDENIERNVDLNEQFFFRKCQAKLVYQEDQIDSQNFQKFFVHFHKIKDKNILHRVQKIINPKVFFSRNDNLAIYYSIIRLINAPTQQKYQNIIKFDNKQRNKYLKDYLSSIDYDVGKNSQKFLNVGERSIKRDLALIVTVILIFLYIIYINEDIDSRVYHGSKVLLNRTKILNQM